MPPGETPVLITEGTMPPGETPVLITEGTMPPGETPVLITEQTMPPGETPIVITEQTKPPGETPVTITVTMPPRETPILITDYTMPPLETTTSGGELVTENLRQTPVKIGTISTETPVETSTYGGEMTTEYLRQTPIKIGTIPTETPLAMEDLENEDTTLAVDVEFGREFEKSTIQPEEPTTVTTEEPTTTNDCCSEYSYKGSPECYQYCELAEQLAVLEALLAQYGRHRHRRSETTEDEEAILDNLYAAFIDIEEFIQFSEVNEENVKLVNEALVKITQSLKSVGALSHEFSNKFSDFNAAREGQNERTLSRPLPYKCSLFENSSVLGEPSTVAACLTFKVHDDPSTKTQTSNNECNTKFGTTVKKLLECSQKTEKCGNEVVFEAIIVLLETGKCVSQEEAQNAVKAIQEKF
eukprot:GFUD01041670.1.p1 GENE.GFUD01041670.1~~GFUD01041670.1.p1  ORF type:complete len:422 (+),score=98.79 GFUD01041670.1:30-1268(+)